MPNLRKRFALLLAPSLLLAAGAALAGQADPPAGDRPNIILIIADDLGFLDLGSYGSEVATPNLDRLAGAGLRLTNFHTAPTCAPTRSMLLSGTDNHLAGFATQENLVATNQQGQPGYEMRLSPRVVTVATLLRDGGYRTYLSGKWHLGTTEDNWPGARGFERWIALLQGGGSHFDNSGISPRDPVVTYLEQGEEIALPEDFYSSDYYTTRMIEFLAADEQDDRPFFAYLAFTAPHWPIQARDEDIARYEGKYDAGYDLLRSQRTERARQLGVIPPEAAISEPVETLGAWDSLTDEQRRIEARKMAVYAGMIDRLDWNVGRLLDYLEKSGQRENTIIVFMSDNGAEGHLMEAYPSFVPWLAANYDNSYENIGRKGSFASLGAGWAHAANGPLRLYKGYMSEGGIRVPMIVSKGSFPNAGAISNAYATVMDIAPTLLDLAGVPRPGIVYDGREILPMRGTSMLPLFEGAGAGVHAPQESIGLELFGRRALYRGDWKALWLDPPHGSGAWELFNLAVDPGETDNLAGKHPAKLAELVEEWSEYSRASGVILPSEPVRY